MIRSSFIELMYPVMWQVILLTAITLGRISSVCALEPAGDLPESLRSFDREVWARVGERTCLRCHRADGEARESAFLLRKERFSSADQISDRAENFHAFLSMAVVSETTKADQSRILLKASGELEHGGGEVLKTDSAGFRVLTQFVEAVRERSASGASTSELESAALKVWKEEDRREFLTDVTPLSTKKLLRRIALSLAGRLPRSEELARVDSEGRAAIRPILAEIMNEPAFFDRLKEGFNDIFLTTGIEDNAETLLSYHHFEKTRLWYQDFDLSHIPEAEQERARWKLADVYREAILREPLELIAYIVRNDRPFTELVTADYIMVSPYTARGYGIFENIRGQFSNQEDPFEYIPAQLSALTGRDGKTQESLTGLYPHAGLMSMFHYLRRYPTTETNRNRLRARMIYQHFLGIDIMQLAPRTTDASAVASKYANPVMEAPDCVVCHRTIDPVAGIFQDFDDMGYLAPRRDGWYQDIFEAGFEGERLPAEQRWRAQQWLSERIVKDDRFSIAMTEHVYYLLFGRRVLQAPEDTDDRLFNSRRLAYREQRRLIENVAHEFRESGFNLKSVFQSLVHSDLYSADGLSALVETDERRAELDDLGVVRMLSPEQLERKIAAIFGTRWAKLEGDFAVLYGGIDSITVTERNADPGGAMGAIQRLLANDVACAQVAKDFRRPAQERVLFPEIEPDVLPGNATSDERIRNAIVYLHSRILGREDRPQDPEVTRTFELFSGIIQDAQAQDRFEKRETYFCGGREDYRVDDPHYSVRAWRGVVTYLLRQHEFLYE
ncbi:MAG: DUF1588 domain-containing protein [Planctomyces sp.]|nr:DUF1588 domain-containing protein [Planctomyces sp.]